MDISITNVVLPYSGEVNTSRYYCIIRLLYIVGFISTLNETRMFLEGNNLDFRCLTTPITKWNVDEVSIATKVESLFTGIVLNLLESLYIS